MVDNQVAIGPDISISDNILSLIKSRIRRHPWNSVPKRHYRDINYVAFVISFLVYMNMTFPLTMHPEEHFLKIKR